jgi:hypothetical protein
MGGVRLITNILLSSFNVVCTFSSLSDYNEIGHSFSFVTIENYQENDILPKLLKQVI